MYDIPDSFDPSCLAGLTLDSVTFAEFVVVFRFGAEVTISAQYAYEYVLPEAPHSASEAMPVTETAVVALVGKRVSRAQVLRRRELEVRLTEGSWLRFLESSQPYESYHIDVSTSRWIV